MIKELHKINKAYRKADKHYQKLVEKEKRLPEKILAAKKETRRLRIKQAQWLLDNSGTLGK